MRNHKKDIVLILIYSVLVFAFIILFVNFYPAPTFTPATLRGIYQISPDGPYYDYRGQVQARIFKTLFEANSFGKSLANGNTENRIKKAR
jgi:hypothetical protein